MSIDDTLLGADLERYLQSLFPVESKTLAEMENLARKKNFPIVGPLVGKLLRLMAEITAPRRVFEMGSGYGYSAWWFLRGMPEGALIVLTDGDAANLKMAQKFLQGYATHQKRFELGLAQDALAKETEPFDIIYVDVDKQQYPDCVRLAHDKLRPGGLLIMDNMLWSGAVWNPDDQRPSTEGIRKATTLLSKGTQWRPVLVPFRDGVVVARKVGY